MISAQFTPPIPFSRLKIRVWFYESDIPLIDKLVSCKSTSIQGTIVKCYRAENKSYEQSHQANPICGIEYCIYDCDQLTIESSIEDHLYNYIDGTISHINLINSGASNPPNFNEFPDEISEYELMQNYHGLF
ncbi:hypothetical protein TUM17378_13920 [Shewanella algae]|nr:hypothetical protein TUM17378_13920 [Shewanella algae]